MKKIIALMSILIAIGFLISCNGQDSHEAKVAKQVERQQSQYGIGQPVETFDWSLERHLVLQLYRIRNQRVATHAVWRSDYGLVEGDCPSMGFGLPYDTSLTNPLRTTSEDEDGVSRSGALTTIEQAEPNGIFASKNTNATWVMCVGAAGIIEPVYVESKVTIYPGPVKVDYDKNRVTRSGKATVNITKE